LENALLWRFIGTDDRIMRFKLLKTGKELLAMGLPERYSVIKGLTADRNTYPAGRTRREVVFHLR
jgi:hypothetical protein